VVVVVVAILPAVSELPDRAIMVALAVLPLAVAEVARGVSEV
jgi:hypothetical protein